MPEDRRHKWWGWGPEGLAYEMDTRPHLWPWIQATLGLADDEARTPPVPRETLVLPPPLQNRAFESALASRFQLHQIRADDEERLRHCCGRSYRDLARLRAGIVPHLPDLVLYPENHGDVEDAVALAADHNVCLIPFGGGTNIVGCVEPHDRSGRMILTLDLARMNRVLAVDSVSFTADLEPGFFGPELEEELRGRGFSLGHFPDSFLYSTLGGWLATRSAGTHSNVYGKIEDMLLALRVVTPRGTLVTKPLPAASNGPDLNRLLAGSEGTLGIITQATMRVHPLPQVEEYRLLLFPSFEQGYHAIRECVRHGCMPSMARLSDENETDLMLAARRPSRGLARWLHASVRRWLQSRGYRRPSALVVCFEGERARAILLRRAVLRILKKHGGFDLGRRPGEHWKESRFDLPLLRDYVMDYGVIADSLETAVGWSRVWPLYQSVRRAMETALATITARPAYVGCHISHLYLTGACVYFTVGFRASEGATAQEAIEQYGSFKRASTDAIVQAGGAVSHHHAIGYEHQPWVDQDLSPLGLAALKAAKAFLDPTDILNPGSLFPPSGIAMPNSTRSVP